MEELEGLSMSSSKRSHKARFGLIVGYGFFVNTVVGAGFLSIPYAYQTGGWLLSLLLQTGCILLGLLFSYMTLETTSLVASIEMLKLQGCSIPAIGFRGLFSKPKEEQSLLERKIPTPNLSEYQYDMSEMTSILLGPRWGMMYVICLSVLFFGSLIAYSSIFATSFVSNVPLGPDGGCDVYENNDFTGNCRWKYMVFVSIYGVFMIYFTLVGFKKQWWMQITLTFMRFVVMALIIICSLIAIKTETYLDSAEKHAIVMPPLANFKQLGTIFSILFFSCLYQTNIPNIAVHIKDKQKNLPRILTLITLTLLLFYLLMGLTVPPATSNMSSMVTLSFKDYTAGGSSHSGREWTYVIEYIVIIFPALDVFSVFPILAITLADNISVILFKQTTKETLSKVSVSLETLLTVATRSRDSSTAAVSG